jgi:hypothetical protein
MTPENKEDHEIQSMLDEADHDPTKCKLCERPLGKDESEKTDGLCYGCAYNEDSWGDR